MELVRVRPVRKPRRIVVLCDVSQSMQAAGDAYLHLMRALTLRSDAEVFAFATWLTRLTPVLRHRSAAVAVEQATMLSGPVRRHPDRDEHPGAAAVAGTATRSAARSS